MTNNGYIGTKAHLQQGASGQNTNDAGSIMLKIKLVELDGSKTANPLQSIPDLSSQSHPGDHCVGYGQETNTYMQSPMTWKVKQGERSHVTFLFRYRSPGEFGVPQACEDSS